MQPSKGFTLIEILISLSIVAVIMTLLYGTFRSTIESSDAIDKRADAPRMARTVFYQLTRDFSMAYQKDQPTESLGLETPFGSLPLEGKNGVRIIEGGLYPADTVAFTSLSYQPAWKGLPISGTSEISYFLSGEALLRKARFLEKEIQNEVGESVLGLNFRYFNGEKQEWFEEWSPSPPTTALPSAIEIELILKDSPPSSTPFGAGPTPGTVTPVGAVLERRFKTVVEIPSSGAL